MVNSSSRPAAARRLCIRGRVQGVYFRASTAERASTLSLRGTVENLDDGSVSVLAGGAPEALDQLTAWLRHGPPLARVDALEWEAIDPAGIDWPAGFTQR